MSVRESRISWASKLPPTLSALGLTIPSATVTRATVAHWVKSKMATVIQVPAELEHVKTLSLIRRLAIPELNVNLPNGRRNTEKNLVRFAK